MQAFKQIGWMFMLCRGDILPVLPESRSLLHVYFGIYEGEGSVVTRRFLWLCPWEAGMEGKMKPRAGAPRRTLLSHFCLG